MSVDAKTEVTAAAVHPQVSSSRGKPLSGTVENRLTDLLDRLADKGVFSHPISRIQRVETHISSVLLTGACAYKFKKPVNLGFLDYSTLARRKRACEAELRLNRRFAGTLYIDVVSITGTLSDPKIGGGGRPIEYAVRMRQFPHTAQADRALIAGKLRPEHFDQFAARLAEIHQSAKTAGTKTASGTFNTIRTQTLQNLEVLQGCAKVLRSNEDIRLLSIWSKATLATLKPVLESRRSLNKVRECHGDLHLANLVLLKDELVPFDCIEFSRTLRFIDVMSEVAFLCMDLEFNGRMDLSRRFLNAYLQRSGDYEGLAVFTYYYVYRALVRAKIAWLRSGQLTGADQKAEIGNVQRYLALGLSRTEPRPVPRLILMHGFSGSGKTHLSGMLCERFDARHLRSDIERKRLAAVPFEHDATHSADPKLYSEASTRRTYEQLARLSGQMLIAGHSVIVDAAFLRRGERMAFRRLAEALGLPFFIIDCVAGPRTLELRVQARNRIGKDASDATSAVLARQMLGHEPMDAAEWTRCIQVRTDQPVDVAALAQRLIREAEED